MIRNVEGQLRILHVIPALSKYNGGTTQAIVGLCQATEGRVSTAIATTEEKLDLDQRNLLARSLPATQLHIFPCHGEGTHNISVPLLRWLRKQAENYDLVHIHSILFPILTACAYICRRACVPYIVSPHGMLSPYTFRSRRRYLKLVYFRLLDRWLLENARMIHFATLKEAERAQRWKLKVPAAIVPLPFNQIQESKHPFVENRGEERVLFLSRLVPNKGLDFLLPAFCAAQEDLGRRIRLVLAGNWEARSYQDYVHSQIRDLNLGKSVAFAGFVEGQAKTELLRTASVFVLLSREENFSFAVVEAMDTGIPVIISDEVGVAPYVTQYRAGLVVPRSVESARKALTMLLENPGLRREMGENGRRLVRECLQGEVVGAQLAELYKNATATAPLNARSAGNEEAVL